MILLCILVAWIAGIGQIGKYLDPIWWPLILLLQLISLVLLLLHWLQRLHWHIGLQYFILCCACISTFGLGHIYANQQLEQRLQYREQQISNSTVLIFVDHIAEKSQLERQQWQQNV